MPYNYNTGGQGALAGAIGGAQMGSTLLPGWGTTIGGILGGAMGALGGMEQDQSIPDFNAADRARNYLERFGGFDEQQGQIETNADVVRRQTQANLISSGVDPVSARSIAEQKSLEFRENSIGELLTQANRREAGLTQQLLPVEIEREEDQASLRNLQAAQSFEDAQAWGPTILGAGLNIQEMFNRPTEITDAPTGVMMNGQADPGGFAPLTVTAPRPAPGSFNIPGMGDMSMDEYLQTVQQMARPSVGFAGAATPPSVSPTFADMIRRVEAGSPDTLFGNAEKGPFRGVFPSQMTIGELLDFQDPNGAYAGWVRDQIGRVSTPAGSFQIVGSTLRDIYPKLGMTEETVFNSDTQARIANALIKRRLTSSGGDINRAITGLREEWEGFKNIPYEELRDWLYSEYSETFRQR